ncbi:MAG: hypothetical protein ACUVXF_10655 [Desulfobaccales bacterium]
MKAGGKSGARKSEFAGREEIQPEKFARPKKHGGRKKSDQVAAKFHHLDLSG